MSFKQIRPTIPISLKGQIIENIKIIFDKGKVVDIKANKNESMLKSHILSSQNGNRLGDLTYMLRQLMIKQENKLK